MKLKKIPSGEVIEYIDLNAAKAYPTKIFTSVEDVRLAYSTQEKGEEGCE